MKEKISKGLFGVISIAAITLGGYAFLFEQMISSGFILFIVGIIANPIFLDYIYQKWGVGSSDYFWGVRLLLTGFGAFFAPIFAMVVFFVTNKNIVDEKAALQNFEAILKMIVYITYMIVLFMYKSEDKFFKYIIFGLFYFFCVILSFASQSINEYIIKILNYIPEGGLDLESYGLLINDLIMPIKEAILTYIIFDTIIENHYKKTDEDIRKNKENKEEHVFADEVFNVEVWDRDGRENINYNIQVKKR